MVKYLQIKISFKNKEEKYMEKVGRNKPCPCGSGKKYKKCCYQKNNTSNEIPFLKEFSQNLPKDAVITTSPQKEKMSEVLLEFAEPLTAACGDNNSFYNALQISAIAWNTSFFPPEERKKSTDECINEYISDKKARETTKEILLKMLRRKEQDFPDIKRMIMDFKVSYRDGERHLYVISSPLNEQQNDSIQQSG